MRQSALVVAVHLFVEIPEHVEWLDTDVGSLQSTLEQAPKILQSVCVDLPVNIAFRMVYNLVRKILLFQSLIGQKRIGIDRALSFYVSANFRLNVMLAARWNHTGADFPAALQDAHNSKLVLPSAFRNHSLAPLGMHEARRATDKWFVHFDVLSLAT